MLAALRDAHQRGARLVSICSAAFALAAAGLLDGQPATTHWQVTDKLQRQYPLVDVLPNRVYVDDGDILTSAGVTAGIDLCLHLIRRDNGAAAANRRARALVAPPQRPGGQAQYVERLLPEASGDQLAPLRTWLLGHLTESIDLDTIAGSAGMSRRTLVRRFREETGTSPMAWLTDARLDRARELLELTDEPVENLGRLTGLGSPASVRAIFHAAWAPHPTSTGRCSVIDPPPERAADPRLCRAPLLRQPARYNVPSRSALAGRSAKELHRAQHGERRAGTCPCAGGRTC